ncbi:MAG: trigger factor [Christensenellales bacterium]|jgi:trigger factor
MEYTLNKISGNQIRFDFTVPAEDFENYIRKAYMRDRKRINVPGFRKGKAPRKLIENMYGEAIFYDSAFEMLFPDIYMEVIDKENITAVDQPSIDIDTIGKGKDLKFNATVYVVPDVELGEYKGLKATRYMPPVTEEDVNKRIEQDVYSVTTRADIVDRSVKEGDYVNIDYSGSVDGEKFEGGTAEKQELKLGSNAFIPGFEEQINGMNIGEEKDITVTFPEQYHAEELAGKEAVFHIKLNSAQEEVRPKLDDEFAQDVSEYDTFEEYKNNIEKELGEEMEKSSKDKVINNLLQQAADASDCDIPEAMIKKEQHNMLRDFKIRLAYQGIHFDDFIKYTGMTEETINESNKLQASENVKQILVMKAIADKEKIEATQEEVESKISEEAKRMGRNVEEFKKMLRDSDYDDIKTVVKNEKVLDLLFDNAEITVKNEEEPKPVDVDNVVEKVEEAVAETENAEQEE